MKIIRAPLRVSLFGGGTDLEPFCSEHGGIAVSFAITRHIYLTWNDRPTGGCRLSYSQVEELDTLRNAQHTLVRDVAQVHGIDEPCTLTITSDLPKGTGLGSSSALSVALAQLVDPTLRVESLVRQAGLSEKAVSPRVGWQDFLPAVYGGFNTYRIDGVAMTERYELNGDGVGVAPIGGHAQAVINRYGLLLYTGMTREAKTVLGSWQKSTAQLEDIKKLAEEAARCIGVIGPVTLGRLLDQTWELKRRISGVSDKNLDEQYWAAIQAGALGGKLCGAGSGGCWFFLVPPERKPAVIDVLGLREIPFQVSEKGVRQWEL